MDLILLQTGNPEIFGGADGFTAGGSLVDGMRRDSTINFGQCIELVSLHQEMKQQITTDISNSARTSGRPVITEFTCVKYVDKTSVKFYEYCLRAEPLGKGAKQPTKLYIARNSSDKIANIITIELRDAIISEIQLQTHPDDMPTEQFMLNFTEILWTYSTQAAETDAAANLSTGWSIARNRPIGQFTD
ncbi:MAG: Hcp family type VI secretion system effector [Burkholderiaceae bacterium]